MELFSTQCVRSSFRNWPKNGLHIGLAEPTVHDHTGRLPWKKEKTELCPETPLLTIKGKQNRDKS